MIDLDVLDSILVRIARKMPVSKPVARSEQAGALNPFGEDSGQAAGSSVAFGHRTVSTEST
jgi:hypothetical protein